MKANQRLCQFLICRDFMLLQAAVIAVCVKLNKQLAANIKTQSKNKFHGRFFSNGKQLPYSVLTISLSLSLSTRTILGDTEIMSHACLLLTTQASFRASHDQVVSLTNKCWMDAFSWNTGKPLGNFVAVARWVLILNVI